MANVFVDPAVRIRSDEVASVNLLLNAGQRDYILKSLDERGGAQELVRQQYSGRYPFELLQNANDAARDRGERGRARFVLTESALLVADNGSGFGERQVEAICSLGRSSKGPGTSIGHKGLGFKSVGEITDRPQILSANTSFQFDADRLHAEMRNLLGDTSARQRFPVYAFPYPVTETDLESDASAAARLRAEGFATIIRLPFKLGLARAAVAGHLADCLHPRLLLFLPDVDHLELRGTDTDFSAEIARDQDGLVEHALLAADEASEEWLIYRNATRPDRAAREALGEAWAQVDETHFAVAVPLDEHSQPATTETFPLHVYFPTEDRPGLHVAVHAEWVLTMDRRHLADTPEAIDFNGQVLAAVAQFVATTVALDLVDRYDASPASVQSVIPSLEVGTGWAGELLQTQWTAALAETRFMPFTDGELHPPTEARPLPSSLGDPERAHHFLALSPNETLRPDVEARGSVRSFLASVAGASRLTIPEVLTFLAAPSSESVAAFYEFLIDWRNVAGQTLIPHLMAVPCVLTTNGAFMAPADHSIFLPRKDSSLPDDLPVPIATVPEVAGVEGLLKDLDVKDFEWRDLIREYLVKILENPDADQVDRERAMRGLRAYQAARRSGGDNVDGLLGRVLLDTRTADGTSTGTRRADEVYFGSDRTGSSALELIYGPFGAAEFLDTSIPADPEEAATDRAFYRMLGVVDHPRLSEVAERYALTGGRHPHGGPLMDEWLAWIDDLARRCPQGHDSSQQIALSYHLDRFAEIAHSKDPARLMQLWNELARNWGKVYEEAMVGTIRCNHGWHSGEKDRAVHSLFAYVLWSREWVPVALAGQAELVQPELAWVETTDPPPRIQQRIPRISEAMYRIHGGSALVASLGLIEVGRPSVDDLLELLASVAAETDESGTDRDIDLAARWIQRSIEDALPFDVEPHADPSSVRFLARHHGQTVFVSQPPYAVDPLLRDTWEQVRPVLSAETGLNRLARHFDLVKLDDAVDALPVALDVRDGDILERIKQRVDGTKPYIYALVATENARAEDRVRPALRRLELVVCDRLLLKYEYDGDHIERGDASCYIATRTESRGRRQHRFGTAYLEIDDHTGEPDWFALGRQLAQYLDAAGHADAITMLLKMDRTDRDRMMTDRQIPESAVVDARETLRLPLEDETDAWGALDALAGAALERFTQVQMELGTVEGHADVDDEIGPIHPEPATTDVEQESASEPPPIDWASVHVTDAMPAVVAAAEMGETRHGGGGSGHTSTAPSIQTEFAKRQVGKRGELVVYRLEVERVRQFGMNPDMVEWRSRTDELAPIDIVSLDEGGDRIFIEVKSTSGSDPAAPFEISRSELLEAGALGARYLIYRVTDANTSSPTVTRWADPLRLIREGNGRLLLSGAQMELGLVAPDVGTPDTADVEER